MSWPADPVRVQIAAAIAGATLIGKPAPLLWDRIEPLGRRRFSVLATGGDLPSLRQAPLVGPGGLVYLERSYIVAIFYERGRKGQSLAADSDAITDDAERIVAALCRMDYDTPTTGLELLHPQSWRIVALPDEGVYSLEIDLAARVRREL
mgnify:CR=1 FL=1